MSFWAYIPGDLIHPDKVRFDWALNVCRVFYGIKMKRPNCILLNALEATKTVSMTVASYLRLIMEFIVQATGMPF
jgi:hypothetical protein